MGDALVSGALVGWCRLGLWVDLMGYSVAHVRGNVWLPVSAAAISYLIGMVSAAASLFVAVFLLASCLIFLLGRSADAGDGGFLHDAFFGSRPKLLVKYLTFLSASVVLPLAVHAVWKFRPVRFFTIFSASGIMVALFVATVIVVDLMLAYTPSRQIKPPRTIR